MLFDMVNGIVGSSKSQDLVNRIYWPDSKEVEAMSHNELLDRMGNVLESDLEDLLEDYPEYESRQELIDSDTFEKAAGLCFLCPHMRITEAFSIFKGMEEDQPEEQHEDTEE